MLTFQEIHEAVQRTGTTQELQIMFRELEIMYVTMLNPGAGAVITCFDMPGWRELTADWRITARNTYRRNEDTRRDR